MTTRKILAIAAAVLVSSTLIAVIAYRLGLRRGSAPRVSATLTELPEGPCIAIQDAQAWIGKPACVRGHVLRAFTSRAGNTFLDFCADYKTCPFASVVFAEDRPKFGDLSQLQGRLVEVRGLVSFYQNRAEIVIHESKQIRVAD